jgi:integrin alpha FG-GAP repeat containing protein 1
VYLWQHSTYSFQPSASFVSDSNILSVVAGDFNYDGLLDVLVTGSSTPTTQYLHLFLAFNSTANAGTINVYTEAPILITDSLVDQPLVFDANADLKLDILAISSLSNLRTVWINNGEAAFTPYASLSPLPLISTLSFFFIPSNRLCGVGLTF